jgi:hypothetical protein
MNYRTLNEGKHKQVCSFCYLWLPKGKGVRLGTVIADHRNYICGIRVTDQDYKEIIDEPCLAEEWEVCPLNPEYHVREKVEEDAAQEEGKKKESK